MESAKEETGALALEDVPPEAGVLALASQELLPLGPPTTYGPHRREESRKKDGKGLGGQPAPLVNPFWSQSMKDEAMLRAMRPSSLPQGSTTSGTEVTQEDAVGMDLKEVMKAVMAQNSMLKRELADLKKKIEDSNKEKDRGFKEADRPKPPSSTPPPSPPAGPPPTTPEAERKVGMTTLGAIPEFPGGERQGLQDAALRPSGGLHEAGRGPPPVPESWLGALQAGIHGGPGYGREGFATPHHGTPGWQGPGRGLPDCAVKNGDLGKGSPLEQAAQSVLRQLGTGAPDGSWGETIRSVELPPLPELREGELGSLVLGDWIQLISPTMRDLSATSWKWWEEVLQLAMTAYREWLRAEPVQRLHIKTQVPMECNTVWSRMEQRGQLMLLNAVPTSIRSETLANRASSSVDVLYALFRRYQPGGLAERSRLLRQLVEPKSPQSLNETVELLRGWRRSLRRAQELEIATPDSTLLLGALDKMSEQIVKASSQAAFRTSSTRAALGVDVTPTLESVLNFADMLTAEAESLAISELQPQQDIKSAPTTTKVKAMSAVQEEKPEKTTGKVKFDGAREEKACRFWGTEEGCRKGQDCKFKHDWTGIEKKGRCYGCSGTGHSKKECPVTKQKVRDSPEKQAVKSIKEKNNVAQVKDDVVEPGPKTGGSEPMEHNLSSEGDKGAGTSGEMKDLLNEATTLLKSLRPSSSMKAIRLSSLEVREGGRALLDGGATHCLRRTSSEEEWARAQEVNVELAAGSAVLRLLPWTRTLLTKENVQVIVPLGVLISLGYEAAWEKTRFELTDPTGLVLDTKVENSCPTIDEALAHELIQEIERSMVRERARLAHLAGEDIGLDVDPEEAKHLTELKDLFPEVPHHLLERLLPKKGWTGEGLPWNRHERRRVRRAKEVVIHLFSGDSKKFWQRELEAESRAVLCIDTVIDQGMNLLRDDIFSYLLDLADGGTVCALLGGPPCRTMSRLRFKQPGPPPLREREGPYRFGLPQLDRYLRKQVEDDTILFLRQLYLHHRAALARGPKVTLAAIGTARGPGGIPQGGGESSTQVPVLLELARMESCQGSMGFDGGRFRPRTHGTLEEKAHKVGNQHPTVGGAAGHPRTWMRRRHCLGGGPDRENQAEQGLVSVGARIEEGTGNCYSGGLELPSEPGETDGPGGLEKTSLERASALQ